MPSLGNVFSNLPELCSEDSEFNFNARHFTVNLTFTVGPHTYNYKMTDGHFNHDGKEELSKLSDDLFDLAIIMSTYCWYRWPFHGRSLPPTEVEYWKKEWKLTKSFFMQVPIQLAKALQLEKPVYMGSSIGGMLAIDLAYHFPNDFNLVSNERITDLFTKYSEVDMKEIVHLTKRDIPRGINIKYFEIFRI